MANYTKVSYKKDELNLEISKIFKQLMEKKVVSAVLAPSSQSSGVVRQTLIVNPIKTAQIDLFAPIIPVNSAKIASSLTAKPSGKNIAMVMRSCEVRAAIELAKLNQINLDDVLLIGLDCFGRFENTDFSKLLEQNLTSESFIQSAQSEKVAVNGFDIVGACKICEYPVPDNVDIRICVIGADTNSFGVEGVSEKGKQALGEIGLTGSEPPGKRKELVEALSKKRSDLLAQKLDEYKQTINSIQALEDSLANCINCYNCRVACPVCYCKECVYLTNTFRHEGEQYLGWAQREGTLKMPTDTAFYHLTRMTHISTFCVGCGQCTSACPNDIELTLAFRSVAKASQARFEYQAGRSLDEQQPLTLFHDDELVEVTGQVK
ncbi:4Fe-4S binding protein [bacterium]|nr:4Fe-4S binding protein [bacterium]